MTRSNIDPSLSVFSAMPRDIRDYLVLLEERLEEWLLPVVVHDAIVFSDETMAKDQAIIITQTILRSTHGLSTQLVGPKVSEYLQHVRKSFRHNVTENEWIPGLSLELPEPEFGVASDGDLYPSRSSLSMEVGLNNKPHTFIMIPLQNNQGNVAVLLLCVAGSEEKIPDLLRAFKQERCSALAMTFQPVMKHALLDAHYQGSRLNTHFFSRALLLHNMDGLLQATMDKLVSEYLFDRIIILRIDDDTGDLVPIKHVGFESTNDPSNHSEDGMGESPDDVMSNESKENGGNNRHTVSQENLAAMVMFFRAALEHNDIQILREGFDDLTRLPNFGELDDVHRALIMPLRIGNRSIGCLYAEQISSRGGYLHYETLRDFSELLSVAMVSAEHSAEIEERAETDALTGLHNRYYFDRALAREIPRVKRYQTALSLLVIDLVDFKGTNDHYGHPFGDFILKETAETLRGNVRSPDNVVRYGGDEFVILMPNTNFQQATIVKDRIEQAFIKRNRQHSDEKMKIVLSMGLRSADASTIDELLSHADAAMYDHKAQQKRSQLIKLMLSEKIDSLAKQHSVVGNLLVMLYQKVPDYLNHAMRVAHLSLKIAKRCAMSSDEKEILVLAALLHDVGKISLPVELLIKSEELTSSESQALQKHPAVGELFFDGVEHLEPIRPAIRHHHESYSGQYRPPMVGFPDKLRGKEIPLNARILCIAEQTDSLITGRPYLPLMSMAEVESFLKREAGILFDPALVDNLLDDKGWHRQLGQPDAINALLNYRDMSG